MAGLGDSLNERGIVRAALDEGHEVDLVASWPQVFHDMPQVRLIRANSTLPYCAQNEADEVEAFAPDPGYVGVKTIPVTYLGEDLKKGMSFMQAMGMRSGFTPRFTRFVAPEIWGRNISILTNRPLLLYRPLVERATWGASRMRNPLPFVYDSVLEAIREQFFVVGVAELNHGIETIVSRAEPDLMLYAGEMTFRQLAYLAGKCALVVSPPGMGLLLGLHSSVPTIGVFGGYETAAQYAHIAPTPFLAIEPENPCCCLTLGHDCDRTTNIERAVERAREFAHAALDRHFTTAHRAGRAA